MERRGFLSAAAGATVGSVLPAAAQTQPAKPGSGARELYLLRKYQLTSAQGPGCDRFLQEAMLPGLARLGYRDVGAFGLEYGPETPATYLLLRHTDAAKLIRLDEELAADAAFATAARPFTGAPGVSPAFQRVENTLLRAFAGRPSLAVPPRARRILQMRTYESPSEADYLRKVEMFHSGEFEIFAACGMPAVFYADNVIAPRMPALTYMLAFESLSELEAAWKRFRDHPAWKKLQAEPRFSGEALVSNITNLLLSPKPFSGI